MYFGGVRSRELGHGPMLLVFLFSWSGIIISPASVLRISVVLRESISFT